MEPHAAWALCSGSVLIPILSSIVNLDMTVLIPILSSIINLVMTELLFQDRARKRCRSHSVGKKAPESFRLVFMSVTSPSLIKFIINQENAKHEGLYQTHIALHYHGDDRPGRGKFENWLNSIEHVEAFDYEGKPSYKVAACCYEVSYSCYGAPRPSTSKSRPSDLLPARIRSKSPRSPQRPPKRASSDYISAEPQVKKVLRDRHGARRPSMAPCECDLTSVFTRNDAVAIYEKAYFVYEQAILLDQMYHPEMTKETKVMVLQKIDELRELLVNTTRA
jgi:hypothetical protein